MARVRVGIVAGGMSSEHEISCVSAGGVLKAIDRERFEPVLIGITKSGKWLLPHSSQVLEIQDGVLPEITDGTIKSFEEIVAGVDVLFPLLHGPFGEDGTFQGQCEMAKIRYVGSGVLASSVAMDKSFAKPIFASHGLEVAPGVVVTSEQWAKSTSVDLSALTFPLFVKPARGGSSRGTTKVKESAQLAPAIEEAFLFDTKVMIETGIIGREIECAVLETKGVAAASPLGEIKILGNHEFYDFDAKYLDGSTQVVFPDDLPIDVQENIQQLAVEAFHALGCEGLARVDFFYAGGKIFINEINTMPGFTPTSVFPKLWAKAGITYSEIIIRLIEGALAK